MHKFTKPLDLNAIFRTGMSYEELSALEDLETSLYLLQPRDIDVITANKLVKLGLMERLVRVDKRHIKSHPRLCFITDLGHKKIAEIQKSQHHRDVVPEI